MDNINILIPTDFSPLSEQALLMADKLSEKLPVKIHLAASEIEADLVIMGTKASDDFTKFISGWEAQPVIGNYKVPVIRLRPGTDNMKLKLKNILLITDFEYFGKGVQINLVKRIAEAFNGTIHLLQIIKESDERYIDLIEAQMKFFAEEHHFERFEIHLYRDYPVSGSIENFSKEAEMDMVCIRTQGRKGIGHLLFGNIAERIVNHTRSPILTFRLKQYA